MQDDKKPWDGMTIAEYQKKRMKEHPEQFLITYSREKDHPLRDNHDDYDEHPK